MTIPVPPSSFVQQCTVVNAQVVVHIFRRKQHLAIMNRSNNQAINQSFSQLENKFITQSNNRSIKQEIISQSICQSIISQSKIYLVSLVITKSKIVSVTGNHPINQLVYQFSIHMGFWIILYGYDLIYLKECLPAMQSPAVPL